jgi:D-arabinose 1-dehydrogenase-like Zn-dependent alcohol dehydrogenase
MKAVRMVAVGRPLEAQEIDDPEPRAGEVRVRVRAAGICHSDAHYRSGLSPTSHLPLTLGHEIAGVVDRLGPGVTSHREGDRVCLHYVLSCGACAECANGRETFCERYAMLGHHADGGFAELVVVPAPNAISLPEEISFEHGAVLMCSSATALHALRRARFRAGESVAVFGLGGLGISAIQFAQALGARAVYAVDLREDRLATAKRLGAIPVNARTGDPAARIRTLVGRGVDVALELVGLPETMRQALLSLGTHGRAALVGLSNRKLEIDPYRELLGPEAELIGVNDHLREELLELIELARDGALDLTPVVTRSVRLHASAINDVLDELDAFRAEVRTVIVME